nr:FHA domain-containing protein [Lachnospiraceae bacterium]
MNYRFKRDLKNSFMIIDAGLNDAGYEKDILRYNDIDVLVPFHTLDVNNVTQVWYDITGLVSLKDYLLQQGITKELIRRVLLYLKIAVDDVERYLIDVNHLLIDVDTIYVVKNNNEWKLMFIYYPDDEEETSIENILEFIMNNSEKELMDFCFNLYDAACGGTNIDGLIRLIDEENDTSDTDGLSYEESEDIFPENEDDRDEEKAFKEMLEGGSSSKKLSIIDKIKNYIKDYFDKSGSEKSATDNSFLKSSLSRKSSTKRFSSKKKTQEEFEDFVFEPNQQIYEPTILLKSFDEEKMSYELQYMGSGCKDNIRINKDEFLLGSCKEGNDCVIDSPVVSRYHAKII